MRDGYESIHVNCQICGNNDYKDIYKVKIDTGRVFGKIYVNNVICMTCGFIYQNPRLTENSLNYYYTHSSISSGSTFRSGNPGSRQDILNRERRNFIERSLQYFGKGEKGLIMDVGCAKGSLLASLDLIDWEKVGVEPSRSAAEAAGREGINIINDFFENVNLENGTADAITLISVLEHARDVSAMMRKSKSLLKPGGILIVEVPDTLRPTVQIADFFSFEHLSSFTMRTLSILLALHGFKLTDTDKNTIVPNLRVCAVLREGMEKEILSEGGYIRNTIDIIKRYTEEKDKYASGIKEKLDSLVEIWRRENLVVGIFGAGVHSHLLLGHSGLSSIVKYVFDNDLKKQGKMFLNWKVLHPSKIHELEMDLIVISSKDFQDEIYEQILPVCSEKGISILRLYETAE